MSKAKKDLPTKGMVYMEMINARGSRYKAGGVYRTNYALARDFVEAGDAKIVPAPKPMNRKHPDTTPTGGEDRSLTTKNSPTG